MKAPPTLTNFSSRYCRARRFSSCSNENPLLFPFLSSSSFSRSMMLPFPTTPAPKDSPPTTGLPLRDPQAKYVNPYIQNRPCVVVAPYDYNPYYDPHNSIDTQPQPQQQSYNPHNNRSSAIPEVVPITSHQIQSSSQIFSKDPKSFEMMCRDIGDDDTPFVYKEEQQHELEEDDSEETWLIPTGFLPFSDDVDDPSTPDVLVFDHHHHPFPSPPHQIHHARKTARTTFTSSSSYYPLTHSESFHLHHYHHYPSSVDTTTYDPFMHKPISPAVQTPSPLSPTSVPPNMRARFSSGSPPKSTPTTHQISRSDARSSQPIPPPSETRNAATSAATKNSRESHLSSPHSRKRQDSTPTPSFTTQEPHTSDSDGLATPTASRIFEMFEQSVAASMEEPFPRKNKKANKSRTISIPNLHAKYEEEGEGEDTASLEQSYLSSQHQPVQMAGLPPSSTTPGPTQQEKFVWHSYGGPRGRRGAGANQNKSKRAPSRSPEVHPDKKKKRQPKGY